MRRPRPRRFVLVPLNDIAPDLVWPDLNKTVAQLLAQLETDEQVDPLLCGASA